MFARGLDSSRIAFAVIGALCGSCGITSGADDGDPGQAPSATGSASVGGGRESPEQGSGPKVMPVKPADQPGAVTDGTLSVKPAAIRPALAAAAAAWTVNLQASPASLWPAQYTTLTATANMDVAPTPYYIRIWDGNSGVYLATCGAGTTCSATVTRANVDFTSFTAVVADTTGLAVAAAFADVDWHGAGVRLTETVPTVPVGGTIALTAITDYDVGPSPFYVEIYDVTAATILTHCGGGTRCSVAVSQTAATTHRYRACLAAYSSSFPPSNALQCTIDHAASWMNASASASARVALGVSPTSNGIYNVTAATSMDVGPTPYYIQIYTVEGALLATCGSGTTCSTSFSPGPTATTLLGFVGPPSPTPPPPAPAGVVQVNTHSRPAFRCPPGLSCQGAPIASGPVLGPTGFPGGGLPPWGIPTLAL
jgi:hypothetical protein